MNLTARTPSIMSSSTSSNPGKASYGHQDPEKHVLHRIVVYPGLLKSGKVEMESTIDQGNLIEILGIH